MTATLVLTEERTFTAHMGERKITDLAVESAWQGLTKYTRLETGEHLIVLNAEQRVITGSPALLGYLNLVPQDEHFVTVPARTLPDGRKVSSFQYAKFPCAKGEDGKILLSPSAKPWVNIDHHHAVAECVRSGYYMTTETQELAIRLDVCEQDINWTGGKVGVGKVFQGLHKGTVSGPQAADYVSSDPEERSWHQLSNGQRVYGLAGNIYTHVYDNIQGDGFGVVHHAFNGSPSVTAAPYASREMGMGWRPGADADWSGGALVRGGYWVDGGYAGVFRLGGVSPDRRRGFVGFRVTK